LAGTSNGNSFVANQDLRPMLTTPQSLAGVHFRFYLYYTSKYQHGKVPKGTTGRVGIF